MTKTHLQVFALAVALSAVGAVSGLARETTDTTLADLAGYRQWRRVNVAPMLVETPSPAG